MSIAIGDKRFSLEEVKQNGTSLAHEFAEDQFRIGLQFCSDWLNDRQTFSFHTSGSTGVPKTILATRQQMQASAQSTIDALSLTSQQHILICLNTQTIAAAMMLVRGLLLGADMTLQEPSSHPLQQLEDDHSFTLASFVPLQISDILHDPVSLQRLNSFKHVLVGGAAIPAPLETALQKTQAKVYHTYGMTETLSHIALKQLGKDRAFQSMPGIEIKTDERGCLCIRGAVTNNEWVITNDLVRMISGHSFEVLGRIDEVINTGGVKVFPTKVEEFLEEIFSGKSLFVYGITDLTLGQKIIAVFEGEEISDATWKEAKSLSDSKLSRYEWPKEYFCVPHFIKTPSGKVDKARTVLSLGFQ